MPMANSKDSAADGGALQINALRRYLARRDGGAGPSSAKGNARVDARDARYCHRYRHAHLIDVAKPRAYHLLAGTMEAPCDGDGPSVESIADEAPAPRAIAGNEDFTFIGVIDEALASKKTAVDSQRRRRNDKFGRFVAAKQNQRAKVVQDHSDARKLIAHRFQRFVAAKRQLRADSLRNAVEASASMARPERAAAADAHDVMDNSQREDDEAEEMPPGRVSIHVGPRKMAKGNLDEVPPQPDTESPQRIDRSLGRCNSEESPVSVADFLVPVCSVDSDERPPVPKMKEDLHKGNKSSKYLEESHSNCKETTRHTTKATTPKFSKCLVDDTDQHASSASVSSKSLTWWDDEENRHKPFTLKTDELLEWCDESTCDLDDGNCVDRGVDGMEAFMEEQCEKLANLFDCYSEKLDNSLSQAVESSKQWHDEGSHSSDTLSTFDTFLETLSSFDKLLPEAEWERMIGRLCNLPSVEEEDRSLETESTRQVCNTSCFGT